MRKLFLLFVSLLFATAAHAQSTNVTATITDSDGTVWANGTVSASFVPNPQFPSNTYIWQGQQLRPGPYLSAALNGSGVLNIVLPSTSFISPANSTWQLTICPNASAPCFNFVTAVNGGSMDLTAVLSAVSIAPRFSPGPFSYGYADLEVQGPRNPGSQYYNVTLDCLRLFDGTWGCGSGSGTGNVNGTGLNSGYLVQGGGGSTIATTVLPVNTIAQGLTAGCPTALTTSDGTVNFQVPSCATTLDALGNVTFQGYAQAGVGSATHYYQFLGFGSDPSCGGVGKACFVALVGTPNEVGVEIDGGPFQPLVFGSAYQTVQGNSVAMPQQATLNLLNGTNVTVNCADDPGNLRTNCTINSSAGGTVNSGTAGQLAYYAVNGTTLSGTGAIPNGITATEQALYDSSDKVATDSLLLAEINAVLGVQQASGNPGSYNTGSIWLDTSKNLFKVGKTSSIPMPQAPLGAMTNWNNWANNYITNLIAVADSGSTVHATGVCVGDSTVAGSNTNNVPVTNNVTSWCQALDTSGLTPKLAEKIQARIGKRSGQNGNGGAGWISANTQLTNGGQGHAVGTTVTVINSGDWTYTGHDGSTTKCPDDTKVYNATLNDIITFTDASTTSMTGYVLGTTNGGTFACSKDGAAYGGNVSSAGAGTLITDATCTLTAAAAGSHTLAMKVTGLGTGSTGVTFCGVHSTNTANTATFEMVKLASGGAELNQWNSTVPNANLTTVVSDPAFVMIETGPNEYVNGDRTPAQVASDLHTAQARINSIWPNAAVIYVLPQRDYRASGSGSTFNDYITAMREQANADGVAVVDLYDYTSNATQIAGWSPCPYSTPGACGTGVHMDEQGNTFLGDLAYHQVIPSVGTNTGYGWNLVSVTGAYTVTAADFSTPDHVGNMLLTQGASNVTFTLTAPTTPYGCVIIDNTSNAGLSDTIDPSGNPVDGSSTTFTIARGQWVQLCILSTGYKSIGLSSRTGVATTSGTLTNTAFVTANASSQLQTPSATSTLDSSGNATFAGSMTATTTLDGAGGKVHTDANGIPTKVGNITTVGYMVPWYFTQSSFTLSAGVTGGTDITLETPGADQWYQIDGIDMVQSNTPASCTGSATVALQVDYTDADNAVHVTGTNNVFFQSATSTTFSTSGTVTPAVSTSAPTGAQIWRASSPWLIHAKASTLFKLVFNVQTNTLASCSPFPTLKVTPHISKAVN